MLSQCLKKWGKWMDKQLKMLNDIAQGRALSDPNRFAPPKKRPYPLLADPDPSEAVLDAFATKKEERSTLPSTSPTNLTITIKPDTIAHRLNNPGNLRYAGQPNATQGEKGFAQFPSPLDGWEALLRQVELEQNRNHTIETMIAKYAPPSENDTQKYIAYMEKKLNASRKTPVKNLPKEKIASAIAFFESNTTINKEEMK